jgi:two-component system, chemotaxis family, response regulator Rcp1
VNLKKSGPYPQLAKHHQPRSKYQHEHHLGWVAFACSNQTNPLGDRIFSGSVWTPILHRSHGLVWVADNLTGEIGVLNNVPIHRIVKYEKYLRWPLVLASFNNLIIGEITVNKSVLERSILLIETDLDRGQQIEAALSSQGGQHRVISIADGGQAMDFLQRRGEYTNAPRPDLVLLELNLPGKDGRDVLAEIKSSAELRRIPIVVLTNADSPEDIFNTYAMQGNCHVVKSTEIESLLAIVRRIEEFWLGIVTLPVG